MTNPTPRLSQEMRRQASIQRLRRLGYPINGKTEDEQRAECILAMAHEASEHRRKRLGLQEDGERAA